MNIVESGIKSNKQESNTYAHKAAESKHIIVVCAHRSYNEFKTFALSAFWMKTTTNTGEN